MAADTFLPALACLIFLPEQLMPNSCAQFRVHGQDGVQKIITVYSAIMDGLVSEVDHMAGAIFP